ncbi:AraC family transcriptional regulator [Vibrio penaeicida]|uniref:AraC family transcriptional regulator n=1 Tax=Vibrio penaeicida TaxID=104609 RepID=UPI0027340C90|nr:AraC family transcriptional regulator [Vibrio penaeicida]MDP2571862.1 AraC family transcriptional regulator [Vibrio penaeicida]
MRRKITIRTYTRSSQGHSHTYYQVLIPTRGFIDLKMDGEPLNLSYGDCLVIPPGCYHEFQAREDFRFLVVDVADLPEALVGLNNAVIPLNEAANNYVQFIEKQLDSDFSIEVENQILALLFELLSVQDLNSKIDLRIKKAVQFINQDIAKNHTIKELANIACLSQTQFKHLFLKHIKLTPLKYLAKVRMERARILLNNTDLPINQVSEKVGFACPSSFTRSFSAYYSLSPKRYRAQITE